MLGSSKSDVYERQILTSKDGPRTEWRKPLFRRIRQNWTWRVCLKWRDLLDVTAHHTLTSDSKSGSSRSAAERATPRALSLPTTLLDLYERTEKIHFISVKYHYQSGRCTSEIQLKIDQNVALVEGLTASPVMHASRVRTPLMLRGVFREISLFLPSRRDCVITVMAASSSWVWNQCIDVNVTQRWPTYFVTTK